MTYAEKICKRGMDIVLSSIGIIFLWWIIFLGYIASSFSASSSGLFLQRRVGKNGKIFTMYKLKTMRDVPTINTTVTTASDMRITSVGHFLRRYKIDELPQLWNVLKGDMSLVGPRPDVPGYADKLQGDDRVILTIRPGITGPATIKYKNEEDILAKVEDPDKYNKEIIYPDKVKINREYIENYSCIKDFKYLIQTIKG